MLCSFLLYSKVTKLYIHVLSHIPFGVSQDIEYSSLCAMVKLLVTESSLTLCDPMDCSPPAPLSVEFSWQDYWSG